MKTKNTASVGAYLDSSSGFFDVDVADTNRNASDSSAYAGIAVLASAMTGMLRYRASETSGSAVSTYAFRALNTCVDLTIFGTAKPSHFTRPGFSNTIAILNGCPASVTHNAIQVARLTSTLTPDANGLTGNIAHGLYRTPRLLSAYSLNTTGPITVQPRSMDGTNIRYWVRDGSNAPVTTSITIETMLEVRSADGV